MKRILFIDDEPALLSGLKRTLRSKRKEWEMCFASSGPEGLELAQSGAPFDVVVSDMRMPQMDGAEVLRRMKEISPGTLRFVLSGQADHDMAMRVATTAHQYFTKPLDTETLQSGISSSVRLQGIIEHPALRKILGGITNLPVLPQTYRKLQDSLSAEEVSLDEVAEIVTTDSALTAKILQLVNSSYFGLPRHLDSLRESIGYIGLTNLKTLVLSYGLVEQFQKCTAAKSFDPDAEQEAILRVGTLAKIMHGRDRKKCDQAFLAGMLHRIGRLVMATSFPSGLDQVESAVRGDEGLRLAAERQFLGATHCEMGAYLLGTWGLPHNIMEAALFYRTPLAFKGSKGLSISSSVGLANCLLRAAAHGEDDAELNKWLPENSPLLSKVREWQIEAENLISEQKPQAA